MTSKSNERNHIYSLPRACMHLLTYLFAVALWAFWLTMVVFHKLIHDVIDNFDMNFFPDNSVFYFMSCRNSFFCYLSTSAVQIVRFSWLMDF